MVSRRGGAEDDPFLAQSQSIALTARERQEGYDIDLVHSQPRGHLLPLPLSADPASHANAADADPSDAAYFGHSAPPERDHYARGTPAAALQDEKYPAGGTGTGTGSLRARRRRQWYLRPTALVALIGLLVLVVALAVGLGVGLSGKHRAAQSAQGSSSDAAAGASSTTSRNRSSGTVIPSTLEPSSSRLTTTARLSTATESLSLGVVSSSDADPSAGSAAAVLPTTTGSSGATEAPTLSPSSATMRASTGNLPIPASQETTITNAQTTIVVESVGTRQRRSRRAA